MIQLFTAIFLLLLLKTSTGLSCAQNFVLESKTLLNNSSCSNAELCFVSGSSSDRFFSRRGCISGHKYFSSILSGCLYDPMVFEEPPKRVDHWAYFCACKSESESSGIVPFEFSTTNCNVAKPVIEIAANESLSISIGKQKMPVVERKNITCWYYSDSFNRADNETLSKIVPPAVSKEDSTQATSCWLLMTIALTSKQHISRGFVYMDGETPEWFSEFFRLQLTNSDQPPFYFGLLTSYQYSTTKKYYSLLCNYDYCNIVNDVDSVSVNQTTECFVGWSTTASGKPSTCYGQFCFYAVDNFDPIPTRGCLSQDYSKASGRIEVGMMQLSSTHYICAESFCNKNATTALKSAKKHSPEMTPFMAYEPSKDTATAMKTIIEEDADRTSQNPAIETSTKISGQIFRHPLWICLFCVLLSTALPL